MAKQQCPICGRPVEPNSRYPRYVCPRCAAKVSSREGRELQFSNKDMWGGFVARYADTGAKYPGHEYYIDGVACQAGEARFGGIVIQAVG